MRFSHKHICTSLLVLLFILQGSTIAFADRFYMGPNGSNTTGDGSRSNPYLTLSWIAGNALTEGQGDTVMVMSGTYAGETQFVGFNYRVKGNPDAYLVIMADPEGAARPLIDANNTANSCWSFTAMWQQEEDLAVNDVAYVKISGIDFANPIYHCINIDDGGPDSRSGQAHHIIIDDCQFTGGNLERNSHGLKLAGVDTFLVQNCRFVNNIDAHFDLVGCHYGTIRDCSFINEVVIKSTGSGIVMKGGSLKLPRIEGHLEKLC